MPNPVIITDLLRSSFRCINQLRPGYTHSPSEFTDALFVMNGMLDAWGADDLNAFGTLIQSFPLVPSTQTYTVGPGGTWNGVRPVDITKATLVILTNPVMPLRQDIKLLDAYQWQSI